MDFDESFPVVSSAGISRRNHSMVKTRLVCFLVILVNCVQAQQSPVVQWLKACEDSTHSSFSVQSIAIDSHGNFYTTGGNIPSLANLSEISTVRFSSSCNLKFFENLDSTTDDSESGSSIVVDDSGFSYVAGLRFTGPPSECILVRYSPGGNVDWVEHYPAPSATSCKVILDSTGNLYLGINSYRNILIWKVNQLGMTMDSVSIIDSAFAALTESSIVLADSGNVFIVGNRGYCLHDGDDPMPICFNDGLIVKIDPQCRILWSKVVPNEEVIAAQRDEHGDIVVLGQGILSKYSSDGDTLWSKETDNEVAYMGLAIDSRSRIIVIGYGASEFPYDGVVVYDNDGNVRWKQTLGNSGPGMIQYWATALDSSDNVYVIGNINNGSQGTSCLLTKFDTTGRQLWKATFARAGYDFTMGNLLALDDSANVYAVLSSSTSHGDNGGYLVVKYTQSPSTGLVETFDRNVDNYSLFQNYPNPFNPTTVINYQLPVNGFVSLKVYDVLGREVKTLVNERQTAGSHSITFNAGVLTSGVYFYRIEAGKFSQVRKLSLVK